MSMCRRVTRITKKYVSRSLKTIAFLSTIFYYTASYFYWQIGIWLSQKLRPFISYTINYIMDFSKMNEMEILLYLYSITGSKHSYGI